MERKHGNMEKEELKELLRRHGVRCIPINNGDIPVRVDVYDEDNSIVICDFAAGTVWSINTLTKERRFRCYYAEGRSFTNWEPCGLDEEDEETEETEEEPDTAGHTISLFERAAVEEIAKSLSSICEHLMVSITNPELDLMRITFSGRKTSLDSVASLAEESDSKKTFKVLLSLLMSNAAGLSNSVHELVRNVN